MSQVTIGKHSKGGFDYPNKVVADGPVQSGQSYQDALRTAQSRAGAEMLVPREGAGGFTYDVFAVSVLDRGGREGKKVIASDSGLKLVDNVPALFNAPESFLVDDTTQTTLLTPKGSGDREVARRVLAHARSRDVEGGRAMTVSVRDGGMRTTLSGMLDALAAEKTGLEQREAQLRADLRTAEQALASKRIPYDQAVAAARTNLDGTVSRHAANVSQKGEDLREAQRPGIHRAEAEIARQQGNVRAADGKLSQAQGKVEAAGRKFDEADALRVERDQINDKLPRVREKLRDYEEGQVYYNQYGEYPSNWVGDQYSGYRPLSWDTFDSKWSLTSERDRLESRKSYIDAREPQIRAEARREKERAQEEVRYAERDLSDAKARLYSAEQALMYLPVGSPAAMDAAQRALDQAKADQTQAVSAAQGKLTEAEGALEVNTRGERTTVGELKLALQNAPSQFQRTIDETARKLGL